MFLGNGGPLISTVTLDRSCKEKTPIERANANGEIKS